MTPSKALLPRARALVTMVPITPAGPLPQGKPNSVGLFFCSPSARQNTAGTACIQRLRQVLAAYHQLSRPIRGVPDNWEPVPVLLEATNGRNYLGQTPATSRGVWYGYPPILKTSSLLVRHEHDGKGAVVGGPVAIVRLRKRRYG